MFRIFFFMLGVLNAFCFAYGFSQCNCDKMILEGKIPENNCRYATFIHTLNLLCNRGASTLVETGTARHGLTNCIGDGCSTAIFAEWIKNNGGEFYSVDINEFYLQTASNALGDLQHFVHFIHSDSIAFLENFNKPIDFLYLDSFDYDMNNPWPSQEHHLKEIIAAYPWLTPKSFVMIDDCALPNGGKGKFVIEYLVERGWKVIANSYQVILSRE